MGAGRRPTPSRPRKTTPTPEKDGYRAMSSATLRMSLLALSLCFAAPAGAQKDGGSPPPVPGKVLPNQYLPTEFTLSINGVSPPSYRVELRGQSLVYHVRKFDPGAFAIREVDRTITPSASQWLQFWKAMDSAGLWDWQPSYANPGGVDGTHWAVDIAFGDKRIASFGQNAYPGDEPEPADPAESDSSPPETDAPFRTYLRAVEDLLGGEHFH
jgi:hypothetical protein